jgi:hypothetical protein
MHTTFSLSQTPERLSAFAAATMMTLVVMTGITTLAQTEHADGVLQARAQPELQLPVQRVVVTPTQQVLVTGQRQPRS